MIIYFADRKMNILGSASTGLPGGLAVTADKRTEDIETGLAIFECKVHFDDESRQTVESCAFVGNFLLRSEGGENEFYTITETECDTKKNTVYIYAEDAGLDLLNEVVGKYEATEAKTINHYIETFAYDSGFRVGTNDAAGVTKQLTFEDEETVTARLQKVAEFFGCEVSYSYTIKGLQITNKFINIHAKRGQDLGVTLRLNRDINSIITTRSIVNLATALRCTGGTPDGAEDPITLRGYTYDDGDFWVDGDCLKSRTAVAKWSRYLNPNEPNQKEGYEGHIVKLYSNDDCLTQKALLDKAIAELKLLREIELNFECEIKILPDNCKIGDRVNIVDEAGQLYLSTRILALEKSVANNEYKATLGEHLIKSSGIHQKVLALAEQFAKTAVNAKRALAMANNALSAAEIAERNAQAAQEEVAAAQQAAQEAQQAAQEATQASQEAAQKADAAQEAVDGVVGAVDGIVESVTNAQEAASNAQQAAQEAEEKADKAAQDAAQAKVDAADAKASLETVQTQAATAIQKAEKAEQTATEAKTTADDAVATAEAAKLDAATAYDEAVTLGERLDSVTTTMEADFARKTDLTESEAHLQSQITQNAALISSTVQMMAVIDETANDAQDQAERAQLRAEEARRQADQAALDAEEAQATADEAKAAAESAQEAADSAQAEADSAQALLDQANADLASAKADLETVLSRADATEEEILLAQQAVEEAQGAATSAKATADAAVKVATEAQERADTAQRNADNAQALANAAAQNAIVIQSVAAEAENALAAQEVADEAVEVAQAAQTTANQAVTDAANAQAAADKAAADAAQAVADAEAADVAMTQAAADLVAAKERLAKVLADVDATEDDLAEAQAAVDAAQTAVDEAKANATEAAAYAAQAAIDAAEAQALADNAKAAADSAQAAADAAQQAADEAKAAADSLAVRVIQAETKIQQNADQIALTATKIEQLQFGGRNILENSSFIKNTEKWDCSGVDMAVIDGVPCAHISGEFGVAKWAYQSIINKIDPADLDQQYVYSADVRLDNFVKGETNPYVAIYFSGQYTKDDGSIGYFNGTTVSGNPLPAGHNNEGWVRLVWVLTFPYIATHLNAYVYTRDFTGDLYFKNLKLEKGNKATDWTPAPEDMATADEMDAVTDRVTTAEANIAVNAERIALTATREEVTETLSGYYTRERTDAAIEVKSDLVSIELEKSIDTKVGAVDGKFESFTADFRKRIDFSAETAITITSGEDAPTLKIDNESGVSFEQDGEMYGKWNGKALLSENIVFRTQKESVNGNFGFFPMPDGSLKFAKVGG